jgi:hypothetical protein
MSAHVLKYLHACLHILQGQRYVCLNACTLMLELLVCRAAVLSCVQISCTHIVVSHIRMAVLGLRCRNYWHDKQLGPFADLSVLIMEGSFPPAAVLQKLVVRYVGSTV